MVSALGHSLISKVKEFLYMIGYLGKLITASFLFAKRGKILTMQLLFTYVEALPICCFLAAGIGSKVMRDHIPACQKLIEMLLNIKIE